MTLLFFLAVGFCLYTYAGFPLWLHWRARRLPREQSVSLPDSHLPSVSVVMAAHNEVHNLPGKFASLANLDYPTELLEVLVVSDGSSDGSAEFCRQYMDKLPRWQIIEQSPAAGKPSALNIGVARAQGDVLVMMDARQAISRNAVRALVERLSDDSVGVVSGELTLGNEAGEQAEEVGLYWRYERWIRENESRLFSTTGATGALYALERKHYQPLAADTLLDDFDTPVQLLKQRLRTVLEPKARVFDQAEAEASGEFRRKVRTLAGNWQSFNRHRWLFSPTKNPVWWQFLSHKVFRLLVPVALLLALLASLLGSGWFLDSMYWLQIVFYCVGLMGMSGFRNKLSNVIAVFLQLNAAAVVGAWKAWRGTAAVRWKRSA